MVENDYMQTALKLRESGVYPKDNRVIITIPDAEEILRRGLRWKFNDEARWLPEYDDVVDWLKDNHGKGLLMYGQCGRGKTVIGQLLLPLILNHCCRKIVSCYTAQEMNQHPDDVLAKHIIYLDDIGIENHALEYGNRRIIFPEVVDAAEHNGKLLIISTNLSLHELTEKYGNRTSDRLRAVTRQIPFLGESLRR